MAYISQYQPGSFDPNYDAFSYGVADMARSMREGARMEAEAAANFGRSIGNAIPEVVGGYLEGQKKKEQEKAANEFVKDITGSMFPDFDAYTESQFYAPAGPNGESGANKPTAEIIDFYASQRGLDPVGKTLLALGHDDGAMKNFVKTFGADKAPALLMDMVDTYAANQPKEWTRIPGTNYVTRDGAVVPLIEGEGEAENDSAVERYASEMSKLRGLLANGEISTQEFARLAAQLNIGKSGGPGGGPNNPLGDFNAVGADQGQIEAFDANGESIGLINQSDLHLYTGPEFEGWTFKQSGPAGEETTEVVETEGGDGSGGKRLPHLLADWYNKADNWVKGVQHQAWEDGNGKFYNYGPQLLQGINWVGSALSDAAEPVPGSVWDLSGESFLEEGQDPLGDFVKNTGEYADGFIDRLKFGSYLPYAEDSPVGPENFPKEKRETPAEGVAIEETIRKDGEEVDIEETISSLKGEGVLTEEMINPPTAEDFTNTDLAPIDKVNRQFFDFEDAFDSNSTIYLLDTYGRLGQKGKLIKVKPGSKEYEEIAELGTEQAFVDFTELGYQPIPLEIGRELENYRKNKKGKDQPEEGPSILEMYLAPLTAYGMWRKLKNANNPRGGPGRLSQGGSGSGGSGSGGKGGPSLRERNPTDGEARRMPRRGTPPPKRVVGPSTTLPSSSGPPRRERRVVPMGPNGLPGGGQGRLPGGGQGRLPGGGHPRLPGGGGGTPSPTPQSPYLNPPSGLLRGPIGTRPLGGGGGLRRLRMIR